MRMLYYIAAASRGFASLGERPSSVHCLGAPVAAIKTAGFPPEETPVSERKTEPEQSKARSRSRAMGIDVYGAGSVTLLARHSDSERMLCWSAAWLMPNDGRWIATAGRVQPIQCARFLT